MEKYNPPPTNREPATVSNLVIRSQRGRIISEEEIKVWSKKKKLAYLAIFLFIFTVSFVYFLNIFSYFDALSLCHIKIDKNLLKGNRETIKEAIALIKKQDKSSYKTLCDYIDVIGENYCQACDSRYDSTCQDSFLFDQPGCYIKGTKTIYLLPEKEYSTEIIKKRAEAIKRLSNFSKEFWEKIK